MREEKGHFARGNQLARGVKNRGDRSLNKPYTEAVRDLLSSPQGDVPSSWPKDRRKWTGAQELAERHFAMAKSGDLDTALHMIGRAEGKIPSAPEDREAGTDMANRLLGGMPALIALQMALGLRSRAVDTEVVETPLLEGDVDPK